MRRLVAIKTYSVGTSVRAARRLTHHSTVTATPAEHPCAPGDAVSLPDRDTCPIHLQAVADSFNNTHRLVPQNDRQGNRQLPFPQMDVGTANPRHLNSYKGGPGFDSAGQRVRTDLHWLVKFPHYGSPRCLHYFFTFSWVGLRHQRPLKPKVRICRSLRRKVVPPVKVVTRKIFRCV